MNKIFEDVIRIIAKDGTIYNIPLDSIRDLKSSYEKITIYFYPYIAKEIGAYIISISVNTDEIKKIEKAWKKYLKKMFGK